MLLPLLATCLLSTSHCPLVHLPADSVGMSGERLAMIDHVATKGVHAQGFPGAAIVVGRNGAVVWSRGYGSLDWGAGSGSVDPARTMYDLASLTKVVATTTAIMVLYDRGKIRLDDPVARYLPAFRGGERRRVTIRQLLEHRSGLPAGREIPRGMTSRSAVRRLMLSTPLQHAPGTVQVYSDVGADVLGFVVEAVSHEPLDEFVHRNVFRPLGMANTMFRPPRTRRARIAPTEFSSRRRRQLRGEVHDETAAALGGVAGHAGLFATAHDLAIFAQMMLNGGTYAGHRIVRASTVALFTRRSAGWRALGWETCAGGASCGQHMSEHAFGHTGFTGTSLWIDPDQDLFVIVLANRIHERRDGLVPPAAVLADVRADVADIAELSVLEDGVEPPMPDGTRADRANGWSR
ncbi:MAG TPA: serine hydrolase [Gemmatimonadaceae bacterium]|nr:serine hydrolase [Gemmatimonadaceae bacterium]